MICPRGSMIVETSRPDHERRRAADAGHWTALMDDPELLVLDEPTLGLAPVIIDNIGDAIETLNTKARHSCSSS